MIPKPERLPYLTAFAFAVAACMVTLAKAECGSETVSVPDCPSGTVPVVLSHGAAAGGSGQLLAAGQIGCQATGQHDDATGGALIYARGDFNKELTYSAPETSLTSHVSRGTNADGSTCQPPTSDPANKSTVTSLSNVTVIADTARGVELTEATSAARYSVDRAAHEDARLLGESYRNMSPTELGQALTRAQIALTNLTSDLENSSGGLEQGERAQLRTVLLNARDKATLALTALLQDPKSPAINLTASDANPLAKTAALADVFGEHLALRDATTIDGLANRLVMLEGLPPTERAALFARLKLAATTDVRLRSGEKRVLNVLHNGYFSGDSHRMKDCYWFFSALAPANVRKMRFTTADLRTMWLYRRSGAFPKSPSYTPARTALLKNTSEAFTTVDIYSRESLAVGDLLVYRLPWEASGNVYIVRSYQPESYRADLVELVETSGSLRRQELSLALDPGGLGKDPVFRSGYFGLRLKPADNAACEYKEPLPKGHRSLPDYADPAIRKPKERKDSSGSAQ